jgi:3-oxoacyl-[acyl-carrier protein] reductase
VDLGLKGKAVLCTAASQGIGYAVAREFVGEGARVLITARDRTRLDQARRELAKGPGQVEVFAGDVTRPEDCGAMVAECERRLGGLHVLFASAGGPRSGGVFDLDARDYSAALELNLMSIVHLCRAAVPAMEQHGSGRIVALTSISIKEPLEGLLLSNTARAGAQGFLKTLARELAPRGITVNTVCPGFTATDRLQELADARSRKQGVPAEEVMQGWAAAIPVGRLGRPEEIAAVVAFLASERASFLTGTAIAVDGGAVRSLL